MRASILAPLTALVPLVAAHADDPVTIRIKLHPDVGTTRTTANVSRDTGSMRITDPAGKVTEIRPGGSETVERTTVLAADKDGNPTRYVRVYEKATETMNGTERTFSYQGRTLLYEKQADGNYRIGVAGKSDLDPKDVERLFDKANKASESDEVVKQLDPKKPVRVGESWRLDIKPVAKSLEAQVDEANSAITVKLTKVEPRGKTRVGTFELDSRILVRSRPERGIEMTFEPPAVYTMKGTLELPIDGTGPESRATLTAALKGDGKWSAAGASGKIEFDVTGEIAGRTLAGTDDPAARKVPTVTWLAGPGGWTEFKPKDGSFRAEFPGTPRVVTANKGGLTETRWLVETDRGTVAYGVVVTEFPNPAVINPGAVRKGSVDRIKGARDVKEIKVSGFPGVEFTHDQERGGTTLEVTRRMVVTKERAFEAMTVRVKGGKAPETERFFKSFRVLAKPRDD